MSDQITLSEFDATGKKEKEVLEDLLPRLKKAAASVGADPESVRIRSGKSYSSLLYANSLCFRLCLRTNTRYIEVPEASEKVICNNAIHVDSKKVAGGFFRFGIQESHISHYGEMLESLVIDVINRLPKEWDCCSRYMECSDAKQCVHPNKAFALGCGYRKILASGRVFYGKNRNVD